MAGPSSKDAVKKDEKPSPFDWLCLKISRKLDSKPGPEKVSVFISVPKRVVALATQRNRIKRLIREAVRQDLFFGSREKAYFFRVTRAPDVKTLGLREVKAVVERIKTMDPL